MNLNDQILEKLIESYRAKGLSVDRVLMDPLFKSLPVEEKVKAVIKYGHNIKAGQKTFDKKLVSDAVVGAAGSALALEPFAELFSASFQSGFHKAQGENPPAWTGPVLSKKNTMALAKTAVGGSILAKEVTSIRKFMGVRNAIKKNVVEGKDITQDQAINVISATLR